MFTDLSHWSGEKASRQSVFSGPKKLVLDPLPSHGARYRSLHFLAFSSFFVCECVGGGGGRSPPSLFCHHHTGKLGRGITSNFRGFLMATAIYLGRICSITSHLQGSFDIMRRVKNLNSNLSYPMKEYSSRVPVSTMMLVGQQRPHVISKIE